VEKIGVFEFRIFSPQAAYILNRFNVKNNTAATAE
jgi:hypothetical protein